MLGKHSTLQIHVQKTDDMCQNNKVQQTQHNHDADSDKKETILPNAIPNGITTIDGLPITELR